MNKNQKLKELADKIKAKPLRENSYKFENPPLEPEDYSNVPYLNEDNFPSSFNIGLALPQAIDEFYRFMMRIDFDKEITEEERLKIVLRVIKKLLKEKIKNPNDSGCVRFNGRIK